MSAQMNASLTLMVTGGFRSRHSIEQALSSGAADIVGLGRPMCLIADAPDRLLAGLQSLPRYEDGLGLLPSWLGGLKRIKIAKAMDGFAAIYWFYEQLWLLGHSGMADERLPILKTFMTADKRNKAIMRTRTAMTNNFVTLAENEVEP